MQVHRDSGRPTDTEIYKLGAGRDSSTHTVEVTAAKVAWRLGHTLHKVLDLIIAHVNR